MFGSVKPPPPTVKVICTNCGEIVTAACLHKDPNTNISIVGVVPCKCKGIPIPLPEVKNAKVFILDQHRKPKHVK